MPSWSMLTTETATKGVLRQLGRTRETYGNYYFYLTGLSMTYAHIFAIPVAYWMRNLYLKK